FHYTFYFHSRHPLSIPLVPYTTLFRSRSRRHAAMQGRHFSSSSGAAFAKRLPVGTIEGAPSMRCRAALLCKNHLPRPEEHMRMPDRKSTRLNSSHRTISYAVFCLKKKT